MKLYRTAGGPVVENNGAHYSLALPWNPLLTRDSLRELLLAEITQAPRCAAPQKPLAPIEDQEVWAAGVTYERSREARIEESKSAGGGDFYDRVYSAERPELFFKALSHRVAGPGDCVRIRADSKWTVPEPELTLLFSPKGVITGYTIGNDMSSRDIEGENPLYLPQAKTYDGSCALGPCLYLPETPLPPETRIEIEIRRHRQVVFSGQTPISRMKRSFTSLAEYLFRECAFSRGVFLMTGTGIVPPDGFTLAGGDEIDITIGVIGTLSNRVA